MGSFVGSFYQYPQTMYIDDLRSKAKIGKVSIDVKNNQIRVRFTYPKGTKNDFYLGVPTDANWQKALKTAQTLDSDIYSDNYDSTLVKYKPERAKKLGIANKKFNLRDLWEVYKDLSKERVAATTIKKHWTTYEKHYLGRTPKELLELNLASEFVAHLLGRYSSGSIRPIFSNCLNQYKTSPHYLDRVQKYQYGRKFSEKRYSLEILLMYT